MFNWQKNNYAEHLMLSVFAMSLSNVLMAIMLTVRYFMGFGAMMVIVTTGF